MSAITYTVIVFISCVGHRFVFGVAAASRNTRFQAARYDLTWVGLAPADRASSAWRLHSFDHLVAARHTVSLMFWLRRKKLVGSYLFFSARSCAYFAGP